MPVWPVGTLSVVAPPPARRGMRLWPWVLAALVLVGALTAGTVIFVKRGRQPARQQRHQPGRGQCATAERDGAGRGPDERRTPRHLRGDGERIGQLRRRHVRR